MWAVIVWLAVAVGGRGGDSGRFWWGREEGERGKGKEKEKER